LPDSLVVSRGTTLLLSDTSNYYNGTDDIS
jgi:hypothetical protein